ncbi:MAG: hypothetical protein ACK5DL_07125, partial [Burkholderiales bacterium]
MIFCRPQSRWHRFAVAPLVMVLCWCAAPTTVGAQTFVDDAGRRIELPRKIERVYAAGPPASVLVMAIAPEKLIGWTRAMKPDEAP